MDKTPYVAQNFATFLTTLDDLTVKAAAAQQLAGFAEQAVVTHIALSEMKRRGVELSPALASFYSLLTLFLTPNNQFGITLSDPALNLQGHLMEVVGKGRDETPPAPPTERKQPDNTPPETKADVAPDMTGNVVDIFSRKTLH